MRVERGKMLDDLTVDLVISTIFENERPPKGLSGLIDWRLNGFLSRKLIDQTIRGSLDERTLIPVEGRVSARRWLLVGLGKKEDFTLARALNLGFKLGTSISKLHSIEVALCVPQAMDGRAPDDTERTLIESMRQAKFEPSTTIHWVDASAVRPLEYVPFHVPGTVKEHRAA